MALDAFAMTGTALLLALAFASLGFAAGLVHFVFLKQAVAALLHGGMPTASAISFLRYPLTLFVFGLSATGGRVSLLAALAGFLAARAAVLRQETRSCP